MNIFHGVESLLLNLVRSHDPLVAKILLDSIPNVGSLHLSDGSTLINAAYPFKDRATPAPARDDIHKPANFEMLDMLVASGASLSAIPKMANHIVIGSPERRSFAHRAITTGDVKLVRWMFIKGGISPETVVADNGVTALHIAARFGDVRIIETVLEHASDVDVRCNSGFTPIAVLLRLSSLNELDTQDAFDLFRSREATANPMIDSCLWQGGRIPLSFDLALQGISELRYRHDLCHSEAARSECGLNLDRFLIAAGAITRAPSDGRNLH